MKQLTLKDSFTVSGKGLHTGMSIQATFKPAPVNHGYKFQRIDLDGAPVIDALAENVIETTRGTVIGKGEARVSTVEHALAALYAAGVDNCLVEVNAPELPILDGSAIEYANKINEVGECLWYLNPFRPNCSNTFPSNGSGTFHTRINEHCFYRPTSKYSQT